MHHFYLKFYGKVQPLPKTLHDGEGINHLPETHIGLPVFTLWRLNRSSMSQNMVSVSIGSALPEMWLLYAVLAGYVPA